MFCRKERNLYSVPSSEFLDKVQHTNNDCLPSFKERDGLGTEINQRQLPIHEDKEQDT